MIEDEIAIRTLYAASESALSDGNIDGVLELYSEDAIQLPPDAAPIVGLKEIRRQLVEELKRVSVDTSILVEEVEAGSEIAFARGRYEMIVHPKDGSRETEASGSWLDILKRQPNGSWRIRRSAWSNHDAH